MARKIFVFMLIAMAAFGFCDFFWALHHGEYRCVLDATAFIVGFIGVVLFT